MASINLSGILFGISCLLLLVSEVTGHSYLTNPISRSNQQQSNTGCRGPACMGPCDIPLSSAHRAPIEIQRGATINPQWPRNNHAGGFIRFAWAPTTQSDTASAFDAGVDSVYCHEIGGCGPDDVTNPNGGDSNPSDGSYKPCQTTITVPSHLADGEWTLQWAWFGGAFALGDYYSCVDYKISGGELTTETSVPVFHGGDFGNPTNNGVCKFFNTDRLHQCVNEPCNNPIYPSSQMQTGPAFGIALAGTNSAPTVVATTHSIPAVVPATTHQASPVTTHQSLPATSNQPSPMTTHQVIPVTSHAPVMTTDHAKDAASSSSSSSSTSSTSTSSSSSSTSTSSSSTSTNSCTIGHMKCLTSETYSMCAHSTWGPSQSCAVGLTCHPSGDFIYCY